MDSLQTRTGKTSPFLLGMHFGLSCVFPKDCFVRTPRFTHMCSSHTRLLRLLLLQRLVGKEPPATAALEETPVCLGIRCWASQSLLMLQKEASEYFNFLHVDLVMDA